MGFQSFHGYILNCGGASGYGVCQAWITGSGVHVSIPNAQCGSFTIAGNFEVIVKLCTLCGSFRCRIHTTRRQTTVTQINFPARPFLRGCLKTIAEAGPLHVQRPFLRGTTSLFHTRFMRVELTSSSTSSASTRHGCRWGDTWDNSFRHRTGQPVHLWFGQNKGGLLCE